MPSGQHSRAPDSQKQIGTGRNGGGLGVQAFAAAEHSADVSYGPYVPIAQLYPDVEIVNFHPLRQQSSSLWQAQQTQRPINHPGVVAVEQVANGKVSRRNFCVDVTSVR